MTFQLSEPPTFSMAFRMELHPQLQDDHQPHPNYYLSIPIIVIFVGIQAALIACDLPKWILSLRYILSCRINREFANSHSDLATINYRNMWLKSIRVTDCKIRRSVPRRCALDPMLYLQIQIVIYSEN